MERQKFIARVKNWWWYHKIQVGIAGAVLLALIYMGMQNRKIVPEDYAVALICSEYHSDEEIQALQNMLAGFGEDRNGDGTVTVEVRRYWLDLTGQTETGDSNAIAALDADLAGRKSGLLLMGDPEALRKNSQAVGNPCLPCGGNPHFEGIGLGHLSAAPRAGHPEEAAYQALLNRIF